MSSLERWSGPRTATADCLKEQVWFWSVERRCSVYSGKELYRMAEKRRSENMVKTEVTGAEGTSLQQRLKNASMKGKTVLRLW